MMKKYLIILLLFSFLGCESSVEEAKKKVCQEQAFSAEYQDKVISSISGVSDRQHCHEMKIQFTDGSTLIIIAHKRSYEVSGEVNQ